MKRLILVSAKATSGKDTFVEFFTGRKDLKCKRLAFADNLKQMAKDLFDWDGVKDQKGRDLLIKLGQIVRGEYEIGVYDYKIKEKEYYFIDFNGTRIEDYKIYGNYLFSGVYNKLKDYFSFKKEFWCEKVKDQILLEKDEYDYIFISDVRFESEVIYMKMIFKDLATVRITRPNTPIIDDRSETDLDNYDFDIRLDNNKSLEDFRKLSEATFEYEIKE